MKTHNLKTIQPFYDAVAEGIKTFEIRRNDRDYQHGDTVILEECDSDLHRTGRFITFRIGYVTDFQQQDGYVVFSLLY